MLSDKEHLNTQKVLSEQESIRTVGEESVRRHATGRCCQTNANESLYDNDKPISCSTELLPLNKSSFTLNLICIPRI